MALRYDKGLLADTLMVILIHTVSFVNMLSMLSVIFVTMFVIAI